MFFTPEAFSWDLWVAFVIYLDFLDLELLAPDFTWFFNDYRSVTV